MPVDSRSIFTVDIRLEECYHINRPNKGLMGGIQLTSLEISTLETGVPVKYLLPPHNKELETIFMHYSSDVFQQVFQTELACTHYFPLNSSQKRPV